MLVARSEELTTGTLCAAGSEALGLVGERTATVVGGRRRFSEAVLSTTWIPGESCNLRPCVMCLPCGAASLNWLRSMDPSNSHRGSASSIPFPKTFRRSPNSSFSTYLVACVEIGVRDGLIRVRYSKDRDAGELTFNAAEWDTFVRGVKAGELDL